MASDYPKRPQFFANKVIRLVIKTCAAQEIGAHGAMLIVAVAATEDAARYRRAVTWYDGQLMPLLGVECDKTLRTIRTKCVEAGWLHYERGYRAKPGRYWVTIPSHADDLGDDPTDEGTGIHRQNLASIREVIGNYSGSNREVIGNDSGSNREVIGNDSGSNRATSLPTPTPVDESTPYADDPTPAAPAAPEEENKSTSREAGRSAPPPKPDVTNGPDDIRKHTADFLVEWQACKPGVNGVIHVAGFPTVEPQPDGLRHDVAWQQFYDFAISQLETVKREAILEMMRHRRGVTLDAIMRVARGEITWGRPAIEIKRFPELIDRICAGQEVVQTQVDRKKKTRGEKCDEAAGAFKAAVAQSIGDVLLQQQSNKKQTRRLT